MCLFFLGGGGGNVLFLCVCVCVLFCERWVLKKFISLSFLSLPPIGGGNEDWATGRAECIFFYLVTHGVVVWCKYIGFADVCLACGSAHLLSVQVTASQTASPIRLDMHDAHARIFMFLSTFACIYINVCTWKREKEQGSAVPLCNETFGSCPRVGSVTESGV